MGTVGSLHFVVTDTMADGVPRWIPGPRAVIYGTGIAEVACAIALARRRPWAGLVSAALLTVIWVGNIQMALDAGSGRDHGLFDNALVLWARVPLQLPLIWAALQARSTRSP